MKILCETAIVAALISAPEVLHANKRGNERYFAAVTFEGGKCWFWTGDVGLTADQFMKDLKSRFDTGKGIDIRHSKETPLRCVKKARRMAQLAGFRAVANQVDATAGPIGPPSANR